MRTSPLSLVVVCTVFMAQVVVIAAPAVTPATTETMGSQDMEISIKGQFRGRLAVKKMAAPVSLNLDKAQNFPEDPSQEILYAPLPTSLYDDFKNHSELKGHLAYWPWIPSLPQPPFLHQSAPTDVKCASWVFQVMSAQGHIIFERRGNGQPPDDLFWDGSDSDKGFAVVNSLYASQLTVVTTKGKTFPVPGERVVLPALIYPSDGPLTVELSTDHLFKNQSADLSSEGILLVDKLGERIRGQHLTRIRFCIVPAEDAQTSARTTTLHTALVKVTHLPSDHIQMISKSDAESRGNVAIVDAE